MAGGWSSDGAVQDQIDATVEDAVAYLDEGVQRRGRVASQRNPLRW